MTEYSTSSRREQEGEAFINISDESSLFTLRKLIKLPDDLSPALVNPILPKTGIALLVGKPDCGKSMLARSLALHVALARSEWLDYKLSLRHARALYVTTEDGPRETRSAVMRQLTCLLQPEDRTGENGGRVLDNMHFISMATLTQDELLVEIDRNAYETPYDLIIVDAFGDVFPGKDANSAAEMRKALAPYYAIANTHDTLILFLHHLNKAGYNQAPDQVHVSGSSALAQKVRSIIHLVSESSDENYKLLAISKGNGMASEDKKKAIQLFFDSNTFLFERTGQTVTREMIGKYEISKLIVDWRAIFQGCKEMSSRDLTKILCEQLGVKERRARYLINSELINVRTGYWSYELPSAKVTTRERKSANAGQIGQAGTPAALPSAYIPSRHEQQTGDFPTDFAD